MLVIGNFPCFYQQLLDFTTHLLRPLFSHNVERVDRQDDQVAAHLFSTESLTFHISHHQSQVGLSVYSFVIGKLVDAQQNHNICYADRIWMLWARFFLMAWRSHIVAHPNHPPHIQFISRESYNNFLTLCDCLLLLIVIYRSSIPHTLFCLGCTQLSHVSISLVPCVSWRRISTSQCRVQSSFCCTSNTMIRKKAIECRNGILFAKPIIVYRKH